MVVVGEEDGCDEYSIVEALKQGKVSKPVVAWVSGRCAGPLKSEAVCFKSFHFVQVLN